LSVPILVTTILLIATSFKKTRHFGEPERYVEYATPFIAICSVMYFSSNTTIIITIVTFSVIYILFQNYLYLTVVVKKSRQGHIDGSKVINEYIKAYHSESGEEVRILSNNLQVAKHLMTPNRKVFWGISGSDYFRGIHFTKVFDRNPYLKIDIIPSLIKIFSINHFVLDLRHAPEYEKIFEDDQLEFEEIMSADHLKLFKVCLKI